MTKQDRINEIEEISADLRFAALSLGKENIEAKDGLIKIAQKLDYLVNSPSGGSSGSYDTNLMGGYGDNLTSGSDDSVDVSLEQPTSAESPKSKYGIDQEQKRYYKIVAEFLYIPASDNLEARKKVSDALASIPDFEGKVNVGEAQGMSVKEPS